MTLLHYKINLSSNFKVFDNLATFVLNESPLKFSLSAFIIIKVIGKCINYYFKSLEYYTS